MRIAGIDYGSKLAGTTAIAFVENNLACLLQSERKQDADSFIREWVSAWNPTHLFLDAPLSLPGVYRGLPWCNDFFYREADRALKAMSPMFLGGLTARAIQLKTQLRKEGVEILEVYPSYLARELGIGRQQYKKSLSCLPVATKALSSHLPFPLKEDKLDSWHQFDALLALISGFRYGQGRHLLFGDEAEGAIIV
ncbi:MAG: hypothetical protein KDD06_16200 [Phaeodactylibacter sp.]|nr:hypothetical protein [Phaeodactylibacter sp.]MCB9288413.1 hypothetical protein [Lewinellaceae bacterium]